MGERAIHLKGSVDLEGQIFLIGSYKAPPSRDWRWLTILTPNPNHLRMVSYHISPTGHEDLAVEADYTRAQ